MPILAPRSPKYRSQVSLAQFPRGQASVGPALAVGGAISRLGNIIATRAQELKQERDAAVVGDLYNQWRDKDREQLSQLLERKGKDAVNLDQEYDKFFTKSFADTEGQTENGTQQRMLTEMTAAKRGQDLDILARYQAMEGQRYKSEVQEGMFAQAEKDVRQFGFNDTGVEQTIADLDNWLDVAWPGKDTKALKQQYKSTLLFANMQERINQNPGAALKTLENWKEELGEGYYKLKDNAKTQVKQKTIDDVQAELQSKYESNGIADFEKMRKDLTAKDIPKDIKFEVRQWLDSYEAQQKNANTINDAKNHDDEERTIGMLFLEKDYAGVRNLLRKSKFLDGDELRTWSNAIDSGQNVTAIDEQKRAREVVTINSMISRGVKPSTIQNYIIQTEHLTSAEKTARIDRLNQELESELDAGMKEGKKLLEELIIPTRGAQTKFLKHPLETDRVSFAQDALDNWLDFEMSNNRRPSMGEIKKKARELAVDFKPSIAELINAKQQSLERDRAAFQEIQE